MRLFIAWLGFAAFALLSAGCQPPLSYYYKTKEIERNAAPRPGQVENHFLYERASGQVNVLFVVDNTESGAGFLEDFHISYMGFLKILKSKIQDNGADLGYVVTTVTTPGNLAPKNVLAPSKNVSDHYNELFNWNHVQKPYLMAGMERLASGEGLIPVKSTLEGIKAFKDQSKAPTFVVYILGRDSQGKDLAVGDVVERLKSDYRPFLNNAYIIANIDQGKARNCKNMVPVPKAIEGIKNVGWAAPPTELDVCESDWTGYAEKLATHIINFKKRIILTDVPYLPSTMLFATSSRAFRYGTDFSYNAQSNELRFCVDDIKTGDCLTQIDPGLRPGEPMTVQYHLPPIEKLTGNPGSPVLSPAPGPDGKR